MNTHLVRGLLAASSIFALSLTLIPATMPQPALAQSAKPAVLTSKGVWNANTTYAVDDVVTLRGSTWRSKVAGNKNHVPGSTNPNNAAFWDVLAVGFNPRGPWGASATYQPNELVTYQGQTWRAKITNTNATPMGGANWELWAIKGAPGSNTGIGMGSASAPSISFNGDGNTGIYSPASGEIALVQDGAVILKTGAFSNRNTALGNGTLQSASNVVYSTALGANALQSMQTGTSNTAIGANALTLGTTGDSNTAVGTDAQQSTNGGSENVAVGAGALKNNETGSSNVAIGFVAAINTRGSANVAVGHRAMQDNDTGERNVALGRGALENNTTGSDNIAVGDQAGTSAAIGGSNNIFIGHSGTGFTSNALVIGASQTTTKIAGIYNATSTGGVTVSINSGGILGTQTSSRRFKDDIETITDANAMLARLRPVTFRYKEADVDGSKPLQYGLIAEEAEAVTHDLVAYDKDGNIHTVKYHFLPPLLLSGFQAQQKTIAAQADKIEALEERLRRLEAALPLAKAASLRQ